MERLCTECHEEGCRGVRECPQCAALCHDDVTIDDHGQCYDCHKARLWGEED